jgi:hypothetical protein
MVRAGVVTGTKRSVLTSSSSILSLRMITPGCVRRGLAMISTGAVFSTQLAPHNAAAVRPAMMPERPVHNHAALALDMTSWRAPTGM